MFLSSFIFIFSPGKAVCISFPSSSKIFVTTDEIPEAQLCKELGIKIVDDLGEKIRSSSNFTGIK